MKKILSLCIIVLLALSVNLNGSKTKITEPVLKQIPESIAPLDRDSTIDSLVESGKLDKNASQGQIEQALKNYIGNVSSGEKAQSVRDKKIVGINDKKVEAGLSNAEFSGNKLGQKTTLSKAQSIPYGDPVKTVKVLVLLGEFKDLSHNTISKPSSSIYWTEDFNVEHYQQLLFGDGYYTTKEGVKSPTFKQYFKEQSNGNFEIEGDVYDWCMSSESAAYYGADSDTSHNVNAKQFVNEITEQAVSTYNIDLSQYDLEDPSDSDNDGILNEPDGFVDHLMIIHAGYGQEQSGGGVLGTDAIWSHSSSVDESLQDIGSTGMKIDNYTIEAENGTVGLFTHEFTHDLGIPDDYDTNYTADGDIVEYWSLMGSGSWSGYPSGVMPSGINPYSRILLGLYHGGDWINWAYTKYDEINSIKTNLDTATMYTGNTQAVVISLPEEINELALNTPASGSYEFWGGNGSEANHSITAPLDLTGKTSATLSYDIWYEIEEDWDGGFVQVSEDGTIWESLSTPLTVSDFGNSDGYPSIIASLPGYTGSSNGWVKENIDLGAYAGKQIYLRFSYMTDWASELSGMFIDNVVVKADGAEIFNENAENGFGKFINSDFILSQGYITGSHYYVAEWRSHLGVDEALMQNAKAKVEFNQGMLLWYVNTNYNDNWVGIHPGYGRIGVVDATQYVYLNAGLGNGNESGFRAGYMPFIQLHDAAFSLNKAPDVNLSVYSWAKTTNLKGKQAEPLFDDSKSYFNVKSPYSGLILPKLGLKIRVTGNASDYSRGAISITK